jgi:hypothetical protein
MARGIARIAPTTKPFRFRERLREISMFFQARDEVHKTMRRLVKKLEKAKISYAVMGGMAVNAHKHRRTTGDVDVLLTTEGLETFRKMYVPKFYTQVPDRRRRFVDRANDVSLDILVTGGYPGLGKPGPITFPQPDAVRQEIDTIQVVDLVTLIQLKLAASRYQDFADVVNLIKANNLDDSFAERLHVSVRQDYIECLEEKRREDEYEARQ